MKADLFRTSAAGLGFAAGMLFMASCGGGGDEANAQARQAQLFCTGNGGTSAHWSLSEAPGSCRLSTDGAIRTLTFMQVMAEGWTATLTSQQGNLVFMVFNK